MSRWGLPTSTLTSCQLHSKCCVCLCVCVDGLQCQQGAFYSPLCDGQSLYLLEPAGKLSPHRGKRGNSSPVYYGWYESVYKPDTHGPQRGSSCSYTGFSLPRYTAPTCQIYSDVNRERKLECIIFFQFVKVVKNLFFFLVATCCMNVYNKSANTADVS